MAGRFLNILLVAGYTLFAGSYISMDSNPSGTPPSVALLPAHPSAEQYPPLCPPNFRYYPNYERVLGMPAPLYSDLRPPFHVVHRYYRASMRCWHDDKRKNYPFLNDTQWKEIKRIVDDSYVKLMHGNDDVIYPRFLIEPENPKQMGRGFVPLEHSKFWAQIEKPSHLALYNTTALQVYIWFWKNSPPPMGIQHDWYRESTELSPRTSFFDAILYAMSMVSKDFWTSEDKIQLHKNRWLDRVDLIIASRTDKVLETYFLELEAEKEKKRVEEQQVWYEGFKAAEKAETQTLLNRQATSSRTWQWIWG